MHDANPLFLVIRQFRQLAESSEGIRVRVSEVLEGSKKDFKSIREEATGTTVLDGCVLGATKKKPTSGNLGVFRCLELGHESDSPYRLGSAHGLRMRTSKCFESAHPPEASPFCGSYIFLPHKPSRI